MNCTIRPYCLFLSEKSMGKVLKDNNGGIQIHSRCYSRSLIPRHSRLFQMFQDIPRHSESFRFISMSFRVIPCYSNVIPSHPETFRDFPSHSETFRVLIHPTQNGAPKMTKLIFSFFASEKI